MILQSEQDIQTLAQELRHLSHPIEQASDLDPLFERIKNARVVLLGESSHGTSQFYTARAYLSKRLIAEHDFDFIAVEGDWPDCHRIDDFIKDFTPENVRARDVLYNFERWPTWMWANLEVAVFIQWLKQYNQDQAQTPKKAGFFGLDVYSLWESMEMVIAYLEEFQPKMLDLAYQATTCFEPYGRNEQAYAQATSIVGASCEHEVVTLLKRLRHRTIQQMTDRQRFDLEQNAAILVNAEHYYRTMIQGGPHAWNIRDLHMMHPLDDLLAHHGPDSKAIVWAHNTHIGDARATSMARGGMFNLGQLAREHYGEDQVALVGFGTYQGSVIAARSWGAPMQSMPVPPAPNDSWEHAFHLASSRNQLLICDQVSSNSAVQSPRGHRAIGVVYQPATDAFQNYVLTVLPQRYDAFLYFDQTTALRPLHIPTDLHEVPETYPWGV